MSQPTTPNTSGAEQIGQVIPLALAEQLADAIQNAIEQTREVERAFANLVSGQGTSSGSNVAAAHQGGFAACAAVYALLYAHTDFHTPTSRTQTTDDTQQ